MPDLVIGMGEIGKPLADLLELRRPVLRKDLNPLCVGRGPVAVMHICFPYSPQFVAQVVDYTEEYKPQLTLIHSTVVPGTTMQICAECHRPVAYSPIRGRHGEMHRDLIRYTKFVGAPHPAVRRAAWAYLCDLGLFDVEILSPVEALELAKLMETTYTALLITWAQEIDRFAQAIGMGTTSETILALTEEVPYLPDHLFHPGHIKGHCLMQNLSLLEKVRKSPFVEVIMYSNMACTPEQKADMRRFRARRLEE